MCHVYYSDRTVFDRSLKPNATAIFRPQRILKNYFPLLETLQNDTLKGGGVGFRKFSYAKAGRALHHLKGLCTYNTLVKRVFNHCHT